MKKLTVSMVLMLLAGTVIAGDHPTAPVQQGTKCKQCTVPQSAKCKQCAMTQGGKCKMCAAKSQKVVPQTTCPVMGGKINKNLYVDHDGKRIYVCCKGCIKQVKKNPGKWIKKLEDAGVTLAQAPKGPEKYDGNDSHEEHPH